MGCNDGCIFLGGLCNVLPTLRKFAGNFYRAMQMKHNHDEDLFGDLVLTAVAVFLFTLLVIGIGSFVWWLI